MSVIVTFQDYHPPARYDGVPWTQAQIEEASAPGGPWVVIDTVALALDADPSVPDAQSFTTNQGTADNLWYRITFLDGAGDESEPTAPLQNIAVADAIVPCTSWLTGEDVATCCSVESSSGVEFDQVAEEAQELLFELSGRLFPGVCTQTVRPCWTRCGCGWQVLSRGHIVWRSDSWWCDDEPCGCRSLSQVKLAGYVQSVSQVMIDGAVVDPATYRVDDHKWLTRVRDPADPDTVLWWPGCQALDLDDTQDGTFSVTYSYGRNPPESGVSAASQLACELYKACAGADDCALPAGTTRITRQGITIEKSAFISWGFQGASSRFSLRGWNTGLSLVDVFLNTYNPSGLQRPPVFWAPSMSHRFPMRVG